MSLSLSNQFLKKEENHGLLSSFQGRFWARLRRGLTREGKRSCNTCAPPVLLWDRAAGVAVCRPGWRRQSSGLRPPCSRSGWKGDCSFINVVSIPTSSSLLTSLILATKNSRNATTYREHETVAKTSPARIHPPVPSPPRRPGGCAEIPSSEGTRDVPFPTQRLTFYFA